MREAVDFLRALAQAFSTMTLYKEGHPARERALDRSHGRLLELQEERPTPSFTFLGSEVVLDNRPLRELRHWEWAPRLSEVGIQRLHFVGRVERHDLEAFLDEAFTRLSGEGSRSAEVRQERASNIHYGQVGIVGEDEGSGTGAEHLVRATIDYSLQEEMQGVQWLHGELRDNRQLHLLEAEGIVRSLSVAMHGHQSFLIPLLRLKEFDQYTTTHALNVSVLTMSLAGFLGLRPREIQAFGIAGLLHDLGKVKIPSEILNKPGKLTQEERSVINSHTVEEARIIMETEEHLDLAAVVAYEHHLRIDGGGYPSMRYERATHDASKLVHVCDVFDALRTRRPYREALSMERALTTIRDGAGTDFDADIAHAFLRMMEDGDAQVAEVSVDEPETTLSEEGRQDAGEPGGTRPDDGGAASSVEDEIWDLDIDLDDDDLDIEWGDA